MKDLITPTEVKEILGVSRQWAVQLLREGRIKGRLVGGTRWVTTRKAVEKYQRRQEKKKGKRGTHDQ